MFHPPDLYFNGALVSNDRDEFVELRNVTEVEVPLYDEAHPNNTWQLQKAVDYTFR